VRIVAHDPVYVVRQKIESTPAAEGSAEVSVVVRVRNSGTALRRVRLALAVRNLGADDIVARSAEDAVIELAGGAERRVQRSLTIPAGAVQRWSVDHPHRYACEATITDADDGSVCHRGTDTFGIRTLEVRDGLFLLNGEPVRLAGANRVLDDPQYGGLEPSAVIERDMGMLKEAHLEFARLQHYPCSPAVLEWADRHGLLIIAEAASWGFPEEHLADPAVREQFRAQMRTMIEQQWNHPCIVGWSVGNEYVSWSPEGVSWTKDMKAFVKELDATRPVVFVGLGGVMKHDELPRAQRSLHYSDILCINCYMDPAQTADLLDRVHAVWPERPILITEYGVRTDRVESEQQRVDHFHRVLTLVRERPFICGLSYWTFNDYRSRYPGTNPSGYRPWGIVDPQRKPRGLYEAMRTALAPAKLTAHRDGDAIRVRVTVGTDFASHGLRGYTLQLAGGDGPPIAQATLPDLDPGDTHETQLPCPDQDATAAALTIRLMQPTGFIAASAPVLAD